MIREIRDIVGPQWVLTGQDAKVYGYDAFTVYRGEPSAVVLPGSEEETIEVFRALMRRGVRTVVRGSGTSLSGASVPLGGEVILEMGRLNRVHRLEGTEVEVGPGLVNATVSRSVPNWLFFAPDPSSYGVCSIGGNVSHDSGGIHVLKYGPVSWNVRGLKVALTDGTVEEVSYPLDPYQIFLGSEGTLGLVLRAVLKLTPRPSTSLTVVGVFRDLQSCSRAVVGVFRRGVTPASMEIMDRNSVSVIERTRYRAGIPQEDILLVELDGFGAQEEAEVVEEVIRSHGGEAFIPQDPSPFWKARKGAFPAMGIAEPSYFTLDCNIPRGSLPVVIDKIREIGESRGLFIANVFHAGDGNLHPLLAYDPSDPEMTRSALEAGGEIVRLALSYGGVISGEHGIGIEKVRFMGDYYSRDDLEVMERVRRAFDPQGLLNPCKTLLEEGCPPVKGDWKLRLLYEVD